MHGCFESFCKRELHSCCLCSPRCGICTSPDQLGTFLHAQIQNTQPPTLLYNIMPQNLLKGEGGLLTHLSFDCYTISISAFMLQGNYLSCFSFLFSFSFIFRQSNPQQFSHFPFRHCPCFLALCFPRLHMSQWFFLKYCCICRGRFLWLLIVISSYSFSWAKHSIPTFAYSW